MNDQKDKTDSDKFKKDNQQEHVESNLDTNQNDDIKDVWNFFDKPNQQSIEDERKKNHTHIDLKCKICQKSIKFDIQISHLSKSNLRHHLSTHDIECVKQQPSHKRTLDISSSLEEGSSFNDKD